MQFMLWLINPWCKQTEEFQLSLYNPDNLEVTTGVRKK